MFVKKSELVVYVLLVGNVWVSYESIQVTCQSVSFVTSEKTTLRLTFAQYICVLFSFKKLFREQNDRRQRERETETKTERSCSGLEEEYFCGLC